MPASADSEAKTEMDAVRAILEKHEGSEGHLIALLLEVQKALGYLPPHALKAVATFLGVPETRVWSVATFYNEFRFVPKGRTHVKVCLGTACHIRGGEIIMQAWERKLGIREGEVTPGRTFSLDRVACVGCCSLAPVVLTNDEVQGRMSPMKVEGLVRRAAPEASTPEDHDGHG